MPQSSLAAGSFFASVSAAGENCDGEIWLLTNGAPSAIGRPELHAAEVTAEKFPASIAAVGTNRKLSVGVTLMRVPWYPPK